jgi:hypothetical protein
MNFKLVSDLKEAEAAWEDVTPRENANDLWEMRMAFYKHNPCELHFLTYNDGTKTRALLALQKNNKTGKLEFFCAYNDFNKVYRKDVPDELALDLYNRVVEPAELEYILEEDKFDDRFKLHDTQFYLPLDDLKNAEDYVEKYWVGKSKRKLKKFMRKLERDHKIEMRVNHKPDLDKLFELNYESYGEESSFLTYPERVSGFKELLNTSLKTHIISLIVDGKVESVSFAVEYNGTFHGLNSGTNKHLPNLGKLMVLMKIDYAIKTGNKIYDASTYEGNWKKRFNFKTSPRYKLTVA